MNTHIHKHTLCHTRKTISHHFTILSIFSGWKRLWMFQMQHNLAWFGWFYPQTGSSGWFLNLSFALILPEVRLCGHLDSRAQSYDVITHCFILYKQKHKLIGTKEEHYNQMDIFCNFIYYLLFSSLSNQQKRSYFLC